MQPPISVGTILQNRYQIRQILGQGGFGRTYLADDQGRFSEACVIKEYIPPQAGAYALTKSKELFQREAATLYQIQHPQIPQFRAVFEEGERLFLVQDYVEGSTYSALMEEYRFQHTTFPIEAVQNLVVQLLPVLAQIHSRGIIHRDISPDNIIQRRSDGLPVLIDFGVVKEVATRIQSEQPQGTTVGKPGYAPSEQIQTGTAYPSSDLYSLAVTAIVLMTGEQPAELFEAATATWRWRTFVPGVPYGFADVLDRMLSYRPGDRYPSAEEVLAALEAANVLTSAPTAAPVATPGTTTAPATVAVSGTVSGTVSGAGASGVEPSRRRSPVSPPPPPPSLWDDPWAVGMIGVGIVALAGVGSWAVMRSILANQSSRPDPSPTSSIVLDTGTVDPSPVFSTRPTPRTSTNPSPVVYSQTLDLVPGTPQTLEKRLTTYETQRYVISGAAGQEFSAIIAGEGVLMTLTGPEGEPIDDRADRVSLWEGTLPATGDYVIELKTVQGIRESGYSLELLLSGQAQAGPGGDPIYVDRSVTFLPGQNQATLKDEAAPDQIVRYRVAVRSGQNLGISVVSGDVSFQVLDPAGNSLGEGLKGWQETLSSDGIYQIEVTGLGGPTDFNLRVSRTGTPAATPTPPPTPTSPPLTPPPTPTPPPATPTPTLNPVDPLPEPTPPPAETP
ncbi:MAG: serine/threonine-protein kinase [Prochlorothrix sp.]|mgnify:CR=1 FL=1|nr:serine/threonine-protein kinase [Prochlorothrix sp.]